MNQNREERGIRFRNCCYRTFVEPDLLQQFFWGLKARCPDRAGVGHLVWIRLDCLDC